MGNPGRIVKIIQAPRPQPAQPIEAPYVNDPVPVKRIPVMVPR